MAKNSGWGGARKGSGPKPNPLLTAKMTTQLIERARKAHPEGDCPTPLEYFLSQLWDANLPRHIRFEAAKCAAPYMHPKLSNVSVSNPDDNRLVITLRDFAKPVTNGGEVMASIESSTQPLVVDMVLEDELDDCDE